MNWMLMYDLAFLLAGCYGVSLYIKVSMSGDLNDIKLLLPRKLKPEECLDQAAFLGRVKPWMLVFSVTVILTGAVGAAENLGVGIPHGAYLWMLGMCIAAALAYVSFQRKAAEEYWEQEDEEEPSKNRPAKKRRWGK